VNYLVKCEKLADTEVAFFLVRDQAEATMVELEVNFKENDKSIISGTLGGFLVQHHPCEQVTWWFSLVKQLKH
jgi:hypothetical protein